MKKTIRGLSLFLFFLLLVPSVGCRRDINCSSVILTFADAYGIKGDVYTTDGHPWEEGYLSDEMLVRLLGEDAPAYLHAAVLMCSDLYQVRECGIFITEDRDDALTSAVVLNERIEKLRAFDSAVEGDVMCFGRAVVYFALPDGERARDIWRRLL